MEGKGIHFGDTLEDIHPLVGKKTQNGWLTNWPLDGGSEQNWLTSQFLPVSEALREGGDDDQLV